MLEATEEMLAYYRDLERQGRLRRTPYEYALSQNYCDQTLAKLTADAVPDPVRRSRARLEVQGHPLRYKPEPPPANPSDPTPEWYAKAGHLVGKTTVGRGEVVPTRQYRIRNPIEQYADKFGDDARSVIERFLQDSQYAERIKVVDLHASGGSSVSRLGGLGNVPQYVRDGHARFEWVWRNLGPKARATAEALIFREMRMPNGTLFSLEDFGGYVLPSVKDRNRRWGIAAGSLVALAEQLVGFYKRCPIRVHRVTEEERRLELERAG